VSENDDEEGGGRSVKDVKLAEPKGSHVIHPIQVTAIEARVADMSQGLLVPVSEVEAVMMVNEDHPHFPFRLPLAGSAGPRIQSRAAAVRS
jgi:hypothetical protein